MNYTISNEKLTLVVSSKGGEFQSVKDAEGQELSLIHISEPTRH